MRRGGIRRTDTEPGWIMRRFRDLQRQVDELRAEKKLAYSSLSIDFTLTPGGVEPTEAMPVPAGLTIEAGIEAVHITWSGSASSAPLDTFGRLAVHTSKTIGFTPTAGTEVASIASPNGGITSYAADPGETYYVKFAFVSLRGELGEFTSETAVTPTEAADPDTFSGDIVGGSIAIATTSSEVDSETFSGSTSPAGWSVNNGWQGGTTVVPGFSVVSTGVPAGSDNGSALLLDHGPAAPADSQPIYFRGYVIADAAATVDVEVVTRFRFNQDPQDHTLTIPYERTYVFVRQTGSFTDFTASALFVHLSASPQLVSRVTGSDTTLGDIGTSPLVGGIWYRMRLRAVSSRIEATIWADGDPEPEPSIFQTTANLAPGVTGLAYYDSPFVAAPAIGLDVWFDEFDVETFSTGFTVQPDGVTRVSSIEVATQLGLGYTTPATTPGAVVRSVEVFDAAGASLGFVPIYDAIT